MLAFPVSAQPLSFSVTGSASPASVNPGQKEQLTASAVANQNESDYKISFSVKLNNKQVTSKSFSGLSFKADKTITETFNWSVPSTAALGTYTVSINVTNSRGSSYASTTASFQVVSPIVSGMCGSANGEDLTGAPSTNLCSVGTASAVSGNGPWTWTCAGSNGGTTAGCEALPIINGACGSANDQSLSSAPTTNLCAAGTASALSGSGPWTWTCVGSNSGTTASCEALLAGNDFTVQNGQIIGPNGKVFVPKGIGIMDSDMANAVASSADTPLLTLFPGLNMVRLSCYGLGQDNYSGTAIYTNDTPAALQTFIDNLTAQGIVVEIEDHNPYDTVLTGSTLTEETNWYASLAAAFIDNPYVWFGTMNEPGSGDSAQELAIYDAIRATGNNNPIMLELTGGGAPGSSAAQGLTASDYGGMINVIWDVHFYDWIASYSANQSTVNAALAGEVAGIQTITSVEGTIPVIVGEFGNSTDGTNIDAGGSEVVTAAETSGYGSLAWLWSWCGGCTPASDADLLTINNNTLTSPYGEQVAGYIATTSAGPTKAAVK